MDNRHLRLAREPRPDLVRQTVEPFSVYHGSDCRGGLIPNVWRPRAAAKLAQVSIFDSARSVTRDALSGWAMVRAHQAFSSSGNVDLERVLRNWRGETSSAKFRSMFSETIQLRGHIIDSLTLPKVLDQIVTQGATFNIVEFKIGQKRVDPSCARIEVTAPTRSELDELVNRLREQGAEVIRPQVPEK